MATEAVVGATVIEQGGGVTVRFAVTVKVPSEETKTALTVPIRFGSVDRSVAAVNNPAFVTEPIDFKPPLIVVQVVSMLDVISLLVALLNCTVSLNCCVWADASVNGPGGVSVTPVSQRNR